MKKTAFNPYLPFWEYVPDAEPHVFDGRIYIYGSHDEAGGSAFCTGDYVCWSAPADDLGDWRCEGVIYKKGQDPVNGAPYEGQVPEYEHAFTADGQHLLYAPDVTQGPDGRYYLYYSLDFTGIVSVAACDTPAGKYEFLGYVTREDGSIPKTGIWFDPAVLCEESGNYLYYGFCPPQRFPGMEEKDIPGAMMVRLSDDMHTMISEPICVANGCDTAKGTSFEQHPFFEASSIRHYGGWYYFAYSSLQGHELCYAMAKSPSGPFTYKGVLHSNGDIGFQGNTLATNYTGNNHGGLVKIGQDYYIFGHRHTHGTAYSRQGVAQRIQMLPDGTFAQAEQTSCGLNGGALSAKGTYPAYIACYLTEADRTKVGNVVMTGPQGGALILPKQMPYITQEAWKDGERGLRAYICNMQKGAVCGFKYLEFDGNERSITVLVRGVGTLGICLDTPDAQPLGSAEFDSNGWTEAACSIQVPQGVHAVYMRVLEGVCDFTQFRVE
ncbi:MAG: family 43 glycosylhydrolase [Eubacterium sp.]|nr:family 43 glycosylhydrolase [Eubacterium sp.]